MTCPQQAELKMKWDALPKNMYIKLIRISKNLMLISVFSLRCPLYENFLYHGLILHILEVGHPGIWSRDINIWGTVLGIYLHFLWKIQFFYPMPLNY